MSGREEFDWSRMRREEDEYFAAKQEKPALPIKTMIRRTLIKLAGGQYRSQEEAEKIATLRELPYKEYLLTSHWKMTRKAALERDGHVCRQCASRKQLDVHHLTYKRLGEERTSDLITLCHRCHELEHTK